MIAMTRAEWSKGTAAITPTAAAARHTRAGNLAYARIEGWCGGSMRAEKNLYFVLARRVAERAAHAVEHPLRMLVEPLGRELLAADRAIAEPELGGVGGLREYFLALRRTGGEAEHDRQRDQHDLTPITPKRGRR